jgi:hypothetical protein
LSHIFVETCYIVLLGIKASCTHKHDSFMSFVLLKMLFHPFTSIRKNSSDSVLIPYDVICSTLHSMISILPLNFNSYFKMFEGVVKLIILESHDNTVVLIFVWISEGHISVSCKGVVTFIWELKHSVCKWLFFSTLK